MPYRHNRITAAALLLFFVLVAGYAYFEARNILWGPQIHFSIPSNTLEVYTSFVTIRGQADYISALYMNGRQIPVTEDGIFEEPYVLETGLNHIFFRAEDKTGRTREEVLEIVYTPETSPTEVHDTILEETATSTDTTTNG